MEYKVSVIVPTYNHENYISQALESILSQKVTFPIEILIGDDCSTDKTCEIIKEYKSKYPDLIRLFLHEKNVGATKNAYELLMNARGKYLATLEGDDYWIDDYKLQKQVDFLEQNEDYVGCTNYFTLVDEYNTMLKHQNLSWVKSKRSFTLDDFDGIMMPGQPSTFVRRNIFLDKSKDYSIIYKAHSMIGDRTLMLIFLSFGSFYCFEENMSCYRCPQNSSAQNITSLMYKENHSQIIDDFKQSWVLEEYARDELELNISFEKRRRFFFLDAIIAYLKNRSAFNSYVIRYMYLHLSKPRLAVLLLPINFVKKILVYIKRQI